MSCALCPEHTGRNHCRIHPLSRQEWRGWIRHRLSGTIAAVSKPRMMPSNSVNLAPREILHSHVMDTLHVSLAQQRKAVGHESPFPDNPSRVSPANDMQNIQGTCPKEHPSILAFLIQITTRREYHTHSQLIYMIINFFNLSVSFSAIIID